MRSVERCLSLLTKNITRYSFSFANWYDASKIHFGAIRVLNDDVIAAGRGFGAHEHNNMEIVTIPLSGAIAHKDSMGNEGIIKKGDVQIMSTGTGITIASLMLQTRRL